ncbi:hypothetical protein SDC9_127946 [bioreactor metagenome]|uniref:Uncharacterized protein n=1 Tax=bioreactor metagenome TaxID=1076179 RepID=A0A645CVJ1_9ZZZZ
MVCSISCEPMLFIVEPHITGIISPLCIPIIIPFCISSGVNSSPLKYLSNTSSSVSAICSIKASFTLETCSLNSPSKSSSKFSNTLCNLINCLSLYIGLIIGTILLSYFSLNISIASLYLAFSLSILFINMILGMFSVNSSDFSVPTCIGEVASITIIAASLALKEEITSPLKSKYPGVSNKLYLIPLYSMGASPIL